MPEGDTLWRTAAALNERISGCVVESVEPDTFKRLVGQTVTAVEPVGKHLFIRFDSGLSLHSHLRMQGSWHVYRPGDPWRRASHEVRVVLQFGEWIAVLFGAPIYELVADEQRTAHLGPDILDPDIHMEDVVTRAKAIPGRTIGEVLLDQRVCAGIGNIYKCESLFAHRLNPWTAVANLDDDALRKLYQTARRMMRESAYGIGHSRRRQVHGRAGRPCYRCAHLIQARPQGEQARLTYWCSHCQEQEL